MSDKSDRPSPDGLTLVLRAAFVPDGEQPPPEFAADFSPLTFRATLDRTTGTITCDSAGMNFDGDIRAEWHPDEVQEANAGGDEDAQGTGGGDDQRETRRQPPALTGADDDADARPKLARAGSRKTSRVTRSKRKSGVSAGRD